jgi:hypothetical protein
MESEADDNELQFFLDDSTSSNTNTNYVGNNHNNFSSLDHSSLEYNRLDNNRFGARNPVANQLVQYSKNKKKHKRSSFTTPQTASMYILEKLQANNHNIKIYHGNNQQQQQMLASSPSQRQSNIKRRRVNTGDHDFYSRFYAAATTTTSTPCINIVGNKNNSNSGDNNDFNALSLTTKTKGIRIEPTPSWLRQNNGYHNQTGNNNSYVSSVSSSSSSSYLVESFDNHHTNQHFHNQHSMGSSLGSSPMQHPTPPNLIGMIGAHALKRSIITSTPQFAEHCNDTRSYNDNFTNVLAPGNNNMNNNYEGSQIHVNPYNASANTMRSSNNNIDVDEDKIMKSIYENTDSNSSISSPRTNNSIQQSNAAATPGFVGEPRKSIGYTIFNSSHLQGGRDKQVQQQQQQQQQQNQTFSVTSPSPCAPLREGIIQMEIQ